MMVQAEILSEVTTVLEAGGVESAPLEASVILAEARGVKCRHESPDVALSGTQTKCVFEMARKRADGVPLAYLLGRKEFMSMEFSVDSSVIVPRPETEILVETAASYIDRDGGLFIDAGTGSGNISAALLVGSGNTRCVAIDISMGALSVARVNLSRYDLLDRCSFVCGDMLSALRSGIGVDVIVSNPPYVVHGELDELPREIREHEPLKALDGGEDGLDFYRQLAEEAPSRLKTGGIIAVEVGLGQAEAVGGLFCSAGLDVEATVKDLSGIDRVIVARRN